MCARQKPRYNRFFGSTIPFRKKNGRRLAVQKNPLDHLYTDFLEHFTWIKQSKRWKVREKGEALGRIHFISPKSKDLYYLRLLLYYRKGATSFNDLYTVNSRVIEWKEAYIELRLTENDKHTDEILDKSKDFQGGYRLRSLFVIVLLEL